GNLSTDFIAEMFPHGFTSPAEPTEADQVLLAAAVLAELRMRASETAIDRLDREAEMPPELVVLLEGRPCPISVPPAGAACRTTGGSESCIAATDWRPGLPLLRLRLD